MSIQNRILSLIVFSAIFINFSIAQELEGFFDFDYNTDAGKITLQLPVDKLDFEFLYVNSLSAGIGSNDIGLDRGQLGGTQIVKFIRTGDKVLLVQPNQDYRAISDNPLEQRAVKEAFAESVLWGFPVVAKKEKISDGTIEIDLTPFLLRDAHDVVGRLKRTKQGTYKRDKTRCAIWEPRTKNFPKNSEFESILTFTGDPQGAFIRSVAPNAKSVTVRQHHSFIELPDDNYTPRAFHPYSAYGTVSFYDYATPIEDPIEKRFIRRHRLEKKDPASPRSEAVEPIIYYVDAGCPEPIKSALIEGASWWNQAYEAAGFIDAFQVKEMPADADPMDVRYNMIQWVHRSTRGWSYGSSVSDPRTGEIIKGHVSLGSLRVRQDFMIAQGILSPYDGTPNADEGMKQLALARLRQLSAHEVGHTIGLAHNFASSVNDRASVMDYPHPVIKLAPDGSIDLSEVYDDKIGAWDKMTIRYGYTQFGSVEDEAEGLRSIIHEAQSSGFKFISDRDARPAGGAHPYAHLWDNGASATAELERMMELRAASMKKFGENSIRKGTPYSELEKVLVPLYLMPRYQIEAASKLIGGLEYDYNVKGDMLTNDVRPVDAAVQQAALASLLNVISPINLEVPAHILKLIPPPAFGYGKSRESFDSNTGLSFDALGPAEGLANHTISFLLHHERLARILRNNAAYGSTISLGKYLNDVLEGVNQATAAGTYQSAIKNQNMQIALIHCLKLVSDDSVDNNVTAEVYKVLETYSSKLADPYLKSLYQSALDDPSEFELPKLNDMPPGSPIGCGHFH